MTPSIEAWKKAIGGVVAAEVLLVAAAFLWVALYSHLIAPGQEVSAYRQYAQVASPWVSVIVGVPLFYLLGRWLKSRRAAALLFGLYLAFDVVLLAGFPTPGPIPWAMVAASWVTKLASLLAGARDR
ncbi:MAG: hypothetical protein JNK55_20730 [Rubrivivax sp.]|nr:hypothetical protein [Rubrivivax sp.]